MSQTFATSFASGNIPDSYVQTNVISNPVGLGNSGVIVIIGEADGGPSYSQVSLKTNFFDPTQLDKVTSQYLSGQIVDAMRALTAPSNDTNITGTASTVYIVKTNQGSQASAIVDTNYGTLKDLNYGLPGNSYKFLITSTASEVAPTVSGETITAFGSALNSLTFDVRLNGSVVTVVTLSSTSSDHATISELIIELNTLLPSGIVASAGTASNSLQLTVSPDATAYRKGWGKSFELVDTVSGDLAALGLSPGLTTSSQQPAIEVQISNTTTGLNSTFDVSSVIGLQIGYEGTSATLTINGDTLTTTVVGGSGANLNINMAQYKTVSDLATYINSQTGYSCVCNSVAQQLPCTALDSVSAQPIASTEASVTPGQIKIDAYDWAQTLANSTAVGFTATATAGLPNPMTVAAYLNGGTRGSTANLDIVNALQQIAGIQCNIIVPLFSQDASKDITAGVTNSASAYTISSINAAIKAHCIEYSTPTLKRNRIAILSILDTYQNAKNQAQSLGNYRVSVTMQSSTNLNSVGNTVVFQPWYTSCVAAGMQAGGFYKAIVNKYANVISFADPVGYDNGDPGDVSDALSSGLLVLTQDNSGNRWVSDQTTYGFDSNFVYNSIQAVYLSDILALDLATSFRKAFVGQSLADVSSSSALTFLSQKMAGYRNLKMIASSIDAPLGWKNPKVTVNGPEMDISVEIKLATAVYFVPITINVSEVQQQS